MVLHRFGGLYVDLDYECLKNVEPLLAGFDFVTSYVSDTEAELNNALIAWSPDTGYSSGAWTNVGAGGRRRSRWEAWIRSDPDRLAAPA